MFKNAPYKGDVVDIFALGLTLFFLVIRNYPFVAEETDKVYNLVLNKNKTVFWALFKMNYLSTPL